MMRFFNFLVQSIYWLQAFAAPFFLSCITAFIIYSNNEKNGWIALIVLVIGVIAGIFVAEFIRRRYGISTFFSRIYGPNEMDEKIKPKK